MTERILLKTQDSWPETPSYEEIVGTFGTILAEASEGGYQGDSLYLITNNDTRGFGILTFGWGSCSGCDALEGVSGQKDLDDLQDDLERGIVWFHSIAEARDHVNSDAMASSYLSNDLVHAFNKALEGIAS